MRAQAHLTALCCSSLHISDSFACHDEADLILISLQARKTLSMMRLQHAGAEETAAAADEVGGAALRLLHQLSDCVAAAEALARASQPPLPLLRRAMAAWGLAGRMLALETLKRALVLINRCDNT